ncbi:clp protease adapter protein ClpF, chloroplastic isoform X2 [Aristolochia californica]|uniref:clp protease adapter protein ClpF, chloroplastic isoform X2 n=1 Tax=Aristolochia californica TaxID=171875 RepID=UPI0035D84348
MQGISPSTLAGHPNDGIYATVATCKSNLKVMSLGQLDCKVNRQILTLFSSSYRTRQRRGLRVSATWLFDKGRNRGQDASSERSESANEDILLFFFQLDLATRVQCALNMEQYDIAKQLRNKLSEVEDEIAKQHEAKRGSNSKSEAQDKAISIFRLRTAMQEAIGNEDYSLAADLRDEISKLEADSLAASAKALARENAEYEFRLGQKVTHRLFGYRAVICGMDPVCCESSSWMETANVEKLSRGCNQPFYQVLVDVHADPNLLVAYVPEENLLAVDQPDMIRSSLHFFPVLWRGCSRRFHPCKTIT